MLQFCGRVPRGMRRPPRERHLLLRHHSSLSLRQTFLDFFASSCVGPHLIVPSSSIVPHNDPTLAFVNAGMNQFKSVFLGSSVPPAPMVANAQKCARVGGKHNDLGQVGGDGHHHTFFEMMGNWSFGKYFKRDACQMAWQLLTGPYGLPPDKLFVTYFAGSKELNLPPDTETRDIWREVGVDESRILAFGVKDNFWEMGATGPCGPCTEIHYDHQGRGPAGVNKGFDELVEVWNIVFMEFNRIDNLVLQALATKHVDTGLGLERLAAVKCGSTSNYDSDLFRPLLDAAGRITGAPQYTGLFKGSDHLDTKYRILVDHARMVTVCIADGMFPDTSHRLRNIIRRALKICREDFGSDHSLLVELSHRVAETSIGDHYPEVRKNLHRVKTILETDAEHLKQLEESGRKVFSKMVSEYPSAATVVSVPDAQHVYEALKFVDKHAGPVTEISGDLAFKLYSSFGGNVEHIRTVAAVKGVQFDEDDFERALLQVRRNSKLDGAMQIRDISKFPKTDTSAVHQYSSPEPAKYQFPLVRANIQGMDRGQKSAKLLSEGEVGIIYLDKTSFYAEAGGQVGDKGELVSERGDLFLVTDCQPVMNSPDHVAHLGVVQKGSFSLGDSVQLRIDTPHRLHCMQNHTGAHLLNAALNALLPLTCQRSSFVGPEYFRFDFGAFQTEVDCQFVTAVEEHVHKQISSNLPILIETKSSRELLQMDQVICIPGERYPDMVSTVTLPDGSVEPCCGTHLLSTGDVQSFAIVEVRAVGSGVKSVKCFTGAKAVAVREKGIKLIGDVFAIHDEVQKINEATADTDLKNVIEKIRKKKKLMRDKKELPWSVSTEMFAIMDELLRHALSFERLANKATMQVDMEQVIEDKSHLPFIVHYFDISESPKITLSKITKLSKDKPILLIASTAEGVNARACVPAPLVTGTFDAEKWVSSVAELMGGRVFSPRGQDKTLVCNMAVVKNASSTIPEALERAESFAEKLVQQSFN